MEKLVLIRHGQSMWNAEKRFTGWADVDLSSNGREEATAAGNLLKEKGYSFDIAYSSVLIRAQRTLSIILDILNESNIETCSTWKLNEKHLGALQGMMLEDAENKYGKEDVYLWSRTYKEVPPLLTKDDPRYPGNDIKYKDLKPEEIPFGESLEMTAKRSQSFYRSTITKSILQGKKVVIVAHEDLLISLIMYIEKLTPRQIEDIEIPTASPLVYELDEKLRVTKKYFLS